MNQPMLPVSRTTQTRITLLRAPSLFCCSLYLRPSRMVSLNAKRVSE